YTALSYVWDPPTLTAQISIDNLPISITSSVHTALLALRSPYEYPYLWIDQICINQDNIQEKTEQVKLIREIYHNAERTIAWLGPRPD
ncbi:heterokaryon incompatibility, partial [Hyaloscypha hepaticicola]